MSFEINPPDGPPQSVCEAAQSMLREAMAKRTGASRVIDGWTLTSHGVHPENETDLTRLLNLWWSFIEAEAIFFGDPHKGAFVAAQKI